MQAGRAQRLHRQEIAEQGTVGDIDGEGAAQDVGAPRRIVAFQHLRRAGIFARRDRLPHDLGDIGGIAQSHVQALRADRRHHMRGLADQRDAMLRELPGLLDRQRKQMTSRLDPDAAENGMRSCFPQPPTVRHRSARSAARLPSARQPTPRWSGRRAAAQIRTDLAGCETRSRYFDAAANGRR